MIFRFQRFRCRQFHCRLFRFRGLCMLFGGRQFCSLFRRRDSHNTFWYAKIKQTHIFCSAKFEYSVVYGQIKMYNGAKICLDLLSGRVGGEGG